MKAAVFLLVALLQSAFPVAVPDTCVFPNFSHKDKDALLWLERRIEDGHFGSKGTHVSMEWSKYVRHKYQHFVFHRNTSGNNFEQYLSWLHGDGHVNAQKFFLKDTVQFKLKTHDIAIGKVYQPQAVASMDLNEKEVLLEIPMHYSISDGFSGDELWWLHEAPWEVRLALKLSQERSKSESSIWYPFLRLLPTIRLPLFFSESELASIEDDSLVNEVLSMRRFIMSSFYAVYQHEISSSTFDNFVWAFAMLYSFACRIEPSSGELGSSMDGSHLLIPFPNIYNGSLESEAGIEIQGQSLKIVLLRDASEGSPLSLNLFGTTSRENFLYRGFVPTTCWHDKARIFENLQELVEWSLTAFNNGNDESFSSVPADAAVQSFDDQIISERAMFSSPDFSVGLDGYLDPYMIRALNIASYPNQKVSKNGTKCFKAHSLTTEHSYISELNRSFITNELVGSFCGSGNAHLIDTWNKSIPHYIKLALSRRILSLLDSLSTTLEEDKVLTQACMWEGFSDNDGGSHLCDACQWQTEELSSNDFLALQYRIRKKEVLLHALSAFSYDCSMDYSKQLQVNEIDNTSEDADAIAIHKFLKWCKKNGAQITEAIGVTNFFNNSNLTVSSTVFRGVQAVQDIEQGETICILPLKLSLFERSSSDSTGADSWHLAAAYLLREKSLGTMSKWASYIDILPKSMQTPIYLMPYELHEVQWWPVMRELIQVRRAIRTSFSQLAGLELAWADFEQYRWAVTMVHSRAFTLPVENEDEYTSYVLMPFMDMINHHFEYQADWMSVPVKNGKLEIIAKKRVYKGQQIYASFGPRSNDNLFLYYGFVLENNPFDSAQVFPSFEDAVHWLVRLWVVNLEERNGTIEREKHLETMEQHMWMKAWKAIDNYAAGITEQRPEWWKLINMWADYGYEYMQFQPSPSIYAGAVIDPTLYVALEAVIEALLVNQKIALKGCPHSKDSLGKNIFNLSSFFVCLEDLTWRSATWALHSSLCSDYACRALASLSPRTHVEAILRLSVSLRCVEILNSFPTTMLQDEHLLNQDTHASRHVQLARKYRYVKKKFLMHFIHHVTEEGQNLK